MASLLGGEYCIESLRQDVKDIQTILDEVHSRIGQVKYQSWKFPDKASCDVDVTKLLYRCQYDKDDEEECQMSHVMLYDVLIDRLVYLLQSFICFNEILLNVEKGGTSTSTTIASKKGNPIRSMSVGLTVKKCWGRSTQIAALLQKLAKEVNSKSSFPMIRELGSPETATRKVVVSENVNRSHSAREDKNSAVLSDKDISRDLRTVSCQTPETAYNACETCSRTQSCLHDVGRTIIELCKAQSLPTALEDYQSRYNESVPMSVADLVRWEKHQTKDLSRISRHMTSLVNQVTPLKADLATVKKNEQNVKSELQLCQSVYDRKESELREDFRRREFRSKEAEKDLKKKISTLEAIRTGMQEEMDKFQWKVSDLKDELLQKHREHLAMENSISQLKEEAVEGQQYKQDALKFKSELKRINGEFEDLTQSVNRDRQLYERELTKNENMARHEKMLQEKQRALLTRMETINEECEKMREQILAIEEERDTAVVDLEKMRTKQSNEEKTSEKHQDVVNVRSSKMESLELLRTENENLKSAINEYTERERLIVAYPDLNKGNVPSPMVQGSGDVLTDMRKQVEANQIRIQILDKENNALLKTLEQVNSTSNEISPSFSRVSTRSSTPRSVIQPTTVPLSQPIQLWKTSVIPYEQEQSSDELVNSPEADWYQKHQKSRSPEHKVTSRWESSSSKPPSGRNRSAVTAPNKPNRRSDVPEKNGTRMGSYTSAYSSSSLEAYEKIKQQQFNSENSGFNVRSSFTVGSGKRPNSGRPSSAKSALLKPWT